MWQGLVAITAAKAAEAGYSLNQVVARVLNTFCHSINATLLLNPRVEEIQL